MDAVVAGFESVWCKASEVMVCFPFIENVGNLVCPAGYDPGEAPAWMRSLSDHKRTPVHTGATGEVELA